MPYPTRRQRRDAKANTSCIDNSADAVGYAEGLDDKKPVYIPSRSKARRTENISDEHYSFTY